MRFTMVAASCLLLGLSIGPAACSTKHDRETPIAVAARACTHESELSCPRPILHVRNLAASQRYYRDALGFKLDWDHGDPPDFASISRGDSVIFLCQGCQGNPGAWMAIFTKDVDRLYKEFVRRHAIIKQPPTNMPWGLREMQVADPDGNVMRIGSAIDD